MWRAGVKLIPDPEPPLHIRSVLGPTRGSVVVIASSSKGSSTSNGRGSKPKAKIKTLEEGGNMAIDDEVGRMAVEQGNQLVNAARKFVMENFGRGDAKIDIVGMDRGFSFSLASLLPTMSAGLETGPTLPSSSEG